MYIFLFFSSKYLLVSIKQKLSMKLIYFFKKIAQRLISEADIWTDSDEDEKNWKLSLSRMLRRKMLLSSKNCFEGICQQRELLRKLKKLLLKTFHAKEFLKKKQKIITSNSQIFLYKCKTLPRDFTKYKKFICCKCKGCAKIINSPCSCRLCERKRFPFTFQTFSSMQNVEFAQELQILKISKNISILNTDILMH